jgi:hypothetical protein
MIRLSWDIELPCTSGIYKEAPAGIGETTNNGAVTASLFPNPASDVLSVELNGQVDGAAQLDILITDITGRSVASLYQGKAGAIPSPFRLPAIVPGLYYVTFRYGTSSLKALPLTIK